MLINFGGISALKKIPNSEISGLKKVFTRLGINTEKE
jgi:hypothetical protein